MSCKICFKHFDAKSHKELCCSEECKIINKQNIKKEWYERNKEKAKSDSRDRYKREIHRIKEYSKTYRKLNRDELLERKRQYRKRNKEKIKERSKKYSENNSEKIRKSYLERVYGITEETYQQMLSDQNGVCAICFKPEKELHPSNKKLRKLAVDHCHETGRVRGLLCNMCNKGIGSLNDSLQLLNNAVQYLLKYRDTNEEE